MLTYLEIAFAALALGAALWLRPWRMLVPDLLTPFLAGLVFLPWFWMLPQMLPSSLASGGLSVQLSGACLMTLLLGWPLAVLNLALVAAAVWVVGDGAPEAWLSQAVWLGLVPASLTLALGAMMRRWLPAHVFVYILGRGFLGTAASIFLAGLLYELFYHLVGGVDVEQALVARWLMAWGDAFLTGMFVAIFVAFKPEWLATWSDQRYLVPPPVDADAESLGDAPTARHQARPSAPLPPSAITPPDEKQP